MANKQRNLSDYIDLTVEENISLKYKLDHRGFTCVLTDINPRSSKKDYSGFILAKSSGSNAFTVCDIDFEYSKTDEKFAPRLTFCRTNAKLEPKKVLPNNNYSIVSFRTGKNGYREFWQMIAFLSGFKNILDEKIFQWEYRSTEECIITTIKSKDDNSRASYLTKIIQDANIDETDINRLLSLKTREKDLKTFELASFSSDFIDGISQCLSQKDKIDKSFEHKTFRDSSGEEIDKRKIRNINPKVFYIVGNKTQEMPIDNVSEENQNKRDTLERFIRGQNNLEIISYDELYGKASKIINLVI